MKSGLIVALLPLSLFFLLTSCVTSGDAENTEERQAAGEIDQDSDREHLLTAMIDSMTLEEKIGQRFIVFVPRAFSLDDEAEIDAFSNFLKTLQPGGLILYPWNYETSDDVRAMTTLFQSIADEELEGRRFLICADQEGGRVAAFRFSDIVRLPAAYYVGLHEDPEFVAAAAYVNAVELRDMGVNMNLGPVLDITDRSDTGIIGDRSFGDRPYRVAHLGEAYVGAFQEAGVIATAKHFPGHGVTAVDSHGRLPVVEYTLDVLRYRDLLPFSVAIDSGVPVVMTAHILFPAVDPDYPVTLSEIFLQDLLRDEMGFDGVVISDGLEMGALADNFDLSTTLIRAIRNDVDIILLYTRYDLAEMVEMIRQLVVDGVLTEADIDDGLRRVLRLKYDYGLLEFFE